MLGDCLAQKQAAEAEGVTRAAPGTLHPLPWTDRVFRASPPSAKFGRSERYPVPAAQGCCRGGDLPASPAHRLPRLPPEQNQLRLEPGLPGQAQALGEEQRSRVGSQSIPTSHPPQLHLLSDTHATAAAGTPLTIPGSEHPHPPSCQ